MGTRGMMVAEAETYGADRLWVLLKPIPIELDSDMGGSSSGSPSSRESSDSDDYADGAAASSSSQRPPEEEVAQILRRVCCTVLVCLVLYCIRSQYSCATLAHMYSCSSADRCIQTCNMCTMVLGMPRMTLPSGT